MRNNTLEHSDFEVKQACNLETGDCIRNHTTIRNTNNTHIFYTVWNDYKKHSK